MNRLVIIGNGFDLAHGMKTSYNHFVKWYLLEIFNGLYKNSYKDDGLVATRVEHMQATAPKIKTLIESDTIEKSYLEKIFSNKEYHQQEYAYTFDFKYPFLTKILSSYNHENWVDIENEYYQELLKITKINNKEEMKREVSRLNGGLAILKTKLEEYLSTQPDPPFNESIINIFRDYVKIEDMLDVENNGQRVAPEQTQVLNFNYTTHIENYLTEWIGTHYETSADVNYIHGKIKDSSNPLIFGFGDEMDDHYKILEKLNHNGFLDNMKSFGYFKTENYQKLIRFIKDEHFEVYIMGHSCGLSDRVMLNMIFEDPNCRSIRIFYYQTKAGDNFKTLTQEISRHFNVKTSMRKKIVPFNKSVPLPQIPN